MRAYFAFLFALLAIFATYLVPTLAAPVPVDSLEV
jgi:hypothetical protein